MINELKENLRNELRKKIQDVKEHFNKEKEILKENQTEFLNIKDSINQIKNSVDNLTNRLEQVEDDKIITEKLSNLRSEIDIQIQDIFRTSNMQDQKRTSP